MSNNILTISIITREVVQLFKNSNSFLAALDSQYSQLFESNIAKFSTKEVMLFGTAAIIAKNPVVSRRFMDWFK